MMRRFLGFLTVLFIFATAAAPVHAGGQTIFGPKMLTVSRWRVYASFHRFRADNAKEGVITITKNTLNKKIQEGLLVLNGRFIPLWNFLHSGDTVFEKNVSLLSINRLMVFLRGDSGVSITIKIRTRPSGPPIQADIAGAPEAIKRGESGILTWTSSHAKRVSIDHGIGSVPPSGSLEVFPIETTTYTITAQRNKWTVTDLVTVIVVNSPPIGESQTAATDEDMAVSITLSASDVDEDPLTYQVVTGPGNGSLSGTPPNLTYNPARNYNGSDAFTFKVNDGFADSDPATVSIMVIPANDPPVADAGPDQTVFKADTVCLDGSGSNDVDEDALTYLWSFVSVPSGSTATISDPAPANPFFAPEISGTYEIQLIVNDGTTASAPDTVIITANPRMVQVPDVVELARADAQAAIVETELTVGAITAENSDSVPKDHIISQNPAAGAFIEEGSPVDLVVSLGPAVPLPPVVSISAAPHAIQIGQSATLTWSSIDADTCVIEPGIGNVDLNGSMGVSPTETITYSIIATGPGGIKTAVTTVTIELPGPPIVYITNPLNMVVVDMNFITVSGTVNKTPDSVWVNGIAASVSNGTFTVENIPLQPGANRITATASDAEDIGSDTIHIVREYEYQSQPENSFGEQYENLVPPNAVVAEYDSKRFSIITGIVRAIDNSPIQDVSITIHDHPEYGTAVTDIEGRFSIPVEGGDTSTLAYQKEGLISAQRKVYVPWNDTAIAETMQMISQNPVATTVAFDGNPETAITHQSTEVVDDFGSRSATMVFTGDNVAYSVDEKGQVLEELTTIITRATEFATPESMPAKLPPNSAYTYCVELSVDGAQRIRFEKPVVTWTDNFLGFDVGEAVPVGYYDRDRGVWVPSDNGVVVKLLDTDADGIVDALDADGDDQPDDLNEDSLFGDEVTGLDNAQRYPPGSTFWRVAVTHFSPHDLNWPRRAPADATSPNPSGVPIADKQKTEQKPCRSHTSSFVEERSRIFHEDIPIPGTDMTLHYASNRVHGYKTTISVPASGPSVPASLKRIIVVVEIAGRTQKQALDPLPDQKAEFIWDRLDHLGKPVKGPTTAHVKIGFVYDNFYYSAGNFAQAFGQAGSNPTGIRARQEVVLWKVRDLDLRVQVKGRGVIAEGWTISSHHNLSPVDLSILHKGNGTVTKNNATIINTVAGNGTFGYSGDSGPAEDAQLSSPESLAVDSTGNLYIGNLGQPFSNGFCVRKVDTSGIITTVAGNGTRGYSGDGGPATEARLGWPSGVAIDTSGNLYIADASNSRIRKVDTTGIITTVAGSGNHGYSGDGGPAVEARLSSPKGVAVDISGSLYIADSNNHSIRKVDTSGIITTVAGNGTDGYSGDGGPAVEAWFSRPKGVAVDTSGNLYIADSNNHSVRKVDASGIITTVAGNGADGYSGNGGPATEARLRFPNSVAVDPSGNLYIADLNNHSIRKVDTSGIITTVAGNGTDGEDSDGGPATVARLHYPSDVAVGSAGNIYIADRANNRIRKVASLSGFADLVAGGDIPFAEEDGHGHIMSATGQHNATIDLDTGVTLKEFGYDNDKNLISITDRFDNQTTILRDGNASPAAIISPDGVTTNLTIDGNNHLTKITYPDGNFYDFEYTPDGLMLAETEPEGNRFEHAFDSEGRSTGVFDEEGGHWQYFRAAYENGDILTEVLTGEGNLNTYLDHTDSTGAYTSTITDSTGAKTQFAASSDGLTVNKSFPCGMDLEFKYGVDSQYKFKFVKEMTESTPAALEKVTTRDKTYQDTDADDIPDLNTETVTANSKTTTLVNNVLQSEKTVTSPEARTITTQYNPATLLAESVSVPGLFDTSYGYDTRGRLTSISTGTRETAYTYNAEGFLESVTDPELYITTYTYDAVGRIIGIDRPDGSSVGFTYDNNGNMTVLTNPSTIDHSFGFNKVNLNKSYQTPISGSYSYVYDKDRRLIQTNFPAGDQINHIYNNDRLEQIRTPEGNIDYTYLCSTKVDSITSGTDSVTYGYDGKLITSETLAGTLSQSLGYTYNSDFKLTGFTYAGTTASFAYDNDGLLTGAGNFTITRNTQNGLPESVTGGALSLSRRFNGYGEVTDEDYTISGQGLTSWNLVRDNNGRITNKTEIANGTTADYVYAYDPMGRLLTVTKDSTLVEEYDYDANGTRIYEMNTLRGIAGRNFSYDDEDHLLSAGSAIYSYNLDGYLTAKTDGSDVTTYDYSSRGELLSVTLPDATAIEYLHDPLGRRIAKKLNGTTIEKYLWQGLTRLLAVYDGSDNLVMRFEYADSRMPVAITKGGSTYYLTYDQIGSLRIVADSSGNVIKKTDYDSFGNIIDDTNPSFEMPFGFAGGLHDRDTGLLRFGYRDYDSDTGRWTAKDPALFAGGDSDLYGYVLNNPINTIDPLGLINWSAVRKGAIATLGGGVGIVGGALASTTGVGAVGGVPAVIGGSATFGWGVSQMITGFLDNEIQFMGVKEAVIKNTTNPGLLQDELLGINALGDMLLTGRTAPTDMGRINSVIQRGQSIYNSGSAIMNSMTGDNTDSSPCK